MITIRSAGTDAPDARLQRRAEGHRADYDCSVAAARAALGEEAYLTAWNEGGAMSPQEAIAYALEGSDVSAGEGE
jgi:hypothetical protein